MERHQRFCVQAWGQTRERAFQKHHWRGDLRLPLPYALSYNNHYESCKKFFRVFALGPTSYGVLVSRGGCAINKISRSLQTAQTGWSQSNQYLLSDHPALAF